MGLVLMTVSLVKHLEKVISSPTFNCAGAFGNVRIGWLKSNSSKVFAIKAMKKAEIIESKHVDHIENEKKILEHLNHPFAVSKKKLTFAVELRWFLPRLTVHLFCKRATRWWRSVYLAPQRR